MSTKFNVGDKVQYTGLWRGDGWEYGRVYTVKRCFTSGREEYVETEEVEFGNDNVDLFDLVESYATPRPFQVGDRVRFIADTGVGDFKAVKGAEYIVAMAGDLIRMVREGRNAA